MDKIKKYPNIRSVLFHFERFFDLSNLMKTISYFKDEGYKIGLVLNPDTFSKEVFYYLNKIDMIMFMSVWPGKEGQDFISKVLVQIEILRKEAPIYDILIDGGINDKTILSASMAGVNVFCVGSYISGNDNVIENYDKLMKIVTN